MVPPEGLYRCWVYRSFRRIKYAVDGVYVNAGLKAGRGVPVSTITGRKRRDVGE
jgi:hypothetical protein